MQEGWKQSFRPFCSGEQERIVERACVWIPALSYIGFSAVWPWANALSSLNLNFWSVNCRKEYYFTGLLPGLTWDSGKCLQFSTWHGVKLTVAGSGPGSFHTQRGFRTGSTLPHSSNSDSLWRSLFKDNRVKFSLLEELVILLNTEQGMHPLSPEQMT